MNIDKLEEIQEEKHELIRKYRQLNKQDNITLETAWEVVNKTGLMWTREELIPTELLFQNPDLVYQAVKIDCGVGVEYLPEEFINDPLVFFNLFENQPIPWNEDSIGWFYKYIGSCLRKDIEKIQLQTKEWKEVKDDLPTSIEMKTILLRLLENPIGQYDSTQAISFLNTIKSFSFDLDMLLYDRLPFPDNYFTIQYNRNKKIENRKDLIVKALDVYKKEEKDKPELHSLFQSIVRILEKFPN